MKTFHSASKRAPRDVAPQHVHTVGVARHWDAQHAPGLPARCEGGGRRGTNWVHSDLTEWVLPEGERQRGDKCGALRWGDDHAMVLTTDPGWYSRVAAIS